MFNALRYVVRGGIPWRMLPDDFPPWYTVYQQTQRWLKAGVFEAMVHDLRVVTSSYHWAEQGIRLLVVKLPDAKKGFMLLSRRWVVERSFSWLAHFRRLARDYERLPDTLKGLHFLAFAILMAHRFVQVMAHLL